MIAGLFCALSRAETYPDLFTIGDVLDHPERMPELYGALQRRFRNGDFDRLVAEHDELNRSPRFSQESFDAMLGTLRAYFTQHSHDALRMNEASHHAPFQLMKDGTLGKLSPTDVASWKGLGNKLRAMADAVKADGRTIEQLEAQYNRDRTAGAARRLADALIIEQLGARRLARLAQMGAPSYAEFQVLDHALTAATVDARRRKLPGKIAADPLAYSSLAGVARPNFFRSGVTVVPMTRFEGLFKGIGPGECVRAVCNRYLDAVSRDTIQFKILKDGKETGYVNLYRTTDPHSELKYWFVESVQTPSFGDTAEGQRMMRGLMGELQRFALTERAQIAFPSDSYNSFNFKETVGDLMLPELIGARETEVHLASPSDMTRVGEFVTTDAAQTDRAVNKRAGYDEAQLTNGLVFNKGRVRVLPPLVDQPDWFLQRAHAEFFVQSAPAGVPDQTLTLDPGRRAALLADMVSSLPLRWAVQDIVEKLRREGRHEVANEILARQYKTIPIRLARRPFAEQLAFARGYLEKHKDIDVAPMLQLREELLLGARTLPEALETLRLNGKGDQFRNNVLVLSTFDRYAPGATEEQVVDFYRHALRWVEGDEFDIGLTRKALDRLTQPENYLTVVNQANGGQENRGVVGNKRLLGTLIAETWERFFEKVAEPDRARFRREVLKPMTGIPMRNLWSRFIASVTTIEELADIWHFEGAPKREGEIETELSRAVVDGTVRFLKELDAAGVVRAAPAILRIVREVPGGMIDALNDALLARATSAADIASFHRSGLFSTNELLLLRRSPNTPDAMRAWLRELLPAIVAEHPPVIATQPKRGFFGRLIARVLPKHAEISDVPALREFVALARELPIDRQAAALDAFLKANPTTHMRDRTADEVAARRDLQEWASDLEANGVRHARNKLGAVFKRPVAVVVGKGIGCLASMIRVGR